MFGKVKRWLGIEGVKLELDLPEAIHHSSEKIEGKIRFYSMHEQTIKEIRVVMIEKFSRGRRKNKLVDEYQLGEIEMTENIVVPAQEHLEIDFTLPITIPKSDMDRLEEKNLVLKPFVKTAKFIKGAKSVYRVEAEAVVKGTALNPFDKKEVKLIR